MENRVICISDKFRPNEISINHWIKEGELYTPLKLVKSKLTGDMFFVLSEVQPDNPLYGGYNIKRFGLPVNIEEFVEENQLEEVEI